MQTPVILFDHVTKAVLKAEPGQPGERQLAQVAAGQVAAHGKLPKGP